MTLETMISELHYTSVIEQAVLQKIRKDEKLIEKIAETAYYGENFDFALCRRMPLTRLAVVTYLLLRKYISLSNAENLLPTEKYFVYFPKRYSKSP